MKTEFDQEKWIYKKLELPEIPKIRGKVLPEFPFFCSLKYQGEPNYLIVDDFVFLLNKVNYGRLRWDCAITEKAKNLPKGIFLGELIFGDGRGDVSVFNGHKVDDDLKIVLWDVLKFKNKWLLKEKYQKRRKILESLNLKILSLGCFKLNEPIYLAEDWLIRNKKELLNLFKEVKRLGYEGLIAKDMNSQFENPKIISWTKIKEEKVIHS